MNKDHEFPHDDLTYSINTANQQNTPLFSNKSQLQGYSLSLTNANSSTLESSSVRSSFFSSKARCIKKWRFSPKTFTFQITLFQILIYLIISYLSSNEEVNGCVLYRLGAKYTPAILAYHHFHRLILPIFLHMSLQHILGNIFFQLMWGFRIEQALGTKTFIFLYFIAALGGNLLSTVNEMFIISTGASTSILGILGFGFPYVILTWKDTKNDTLDHFFSFFTYVGTFKALLAGADDTDNSAHRGNFRRELEKIIYLGGFITGLLVAGIFIQGASRIGFHIRNKLAWGALVFLLAFFGFLSYILFNMPDYHERAEKETDLCDSILDW